MSYSNTSATDWADLLDEISTFVVADGWTEEYDVDAGNGKQIAFSKGACEMAIGEQNSTLNPITVESGWLDGRLFATLSTGINAGNTQYWGHPGSPVTTSTDADRVTLNDLGDASGFSNVWLFSGPGTGPDYCHCVIQTAGDRYSHLSFGELDPLGMSTPDVGFLTAIYYQFWPSGSANSPINSNHKFGHFAPNQALKAIHVNIQASTLPASGYDSAGVYTDSSLTRTFTIGDHDDDHYAASQGNFLDFFLPISNQLTTGGTAMWPIPVFFKSTDSTTHVFLGILPGVRLVDIANHTPGSELTFGSETWVVFPFKRKGLQDNLNNGSDPQPEANTISYGLAYKKNV